MRRNRFYSADRRGFYSQGSLTLWTEDPRPNPQPFANSGRNDFTSEDIASHVRELFPDGLSLHGWDFARQWHNPVQGDGDWYIRSSPNIELVFEFVRRAQFPHLPSRLQSFYGFDSLDRVKSFAGGGCPIFELEPSTSFRADIAWLYLGTQLSVASFNAHQYWRGVPSAQPDWEYLLVPPVKVFALSTTRGLAHSRNP